MPTPETVSVVAGGWSLAGVDLSRIPGTIIGVNDSGVRAPRVDAIVSMDRLWTEYRWSDLQRLQRPTWLRQACLHNITEKPDWLRLYLCDYRDARPSAIKGMLNGTNSGLVALNLAYSMAPTRVILFGFDMGRSPRGEAYWHEPYPWSQKGATSDSKYAEWARQFAPAAEAFKARGIEVLNASPKSRIPAFKKVDPAKVLI